MVSTTGSRIYEYSIAHFRMTWNSWRRIGRRPRLMTLEWCGNTAEGRALRAGDRKPEEPTQRVQPQEQELQQREKEEECPWYTPFSRPGERETFYLVKVYAKVPELLYIQYYLIHMCLGGPQSCAQLYLFQYVRKEEVELKKKLVCNHFFPLHIFDLPGFGLDNTASKM